MRTYSLSITSENLPKICDIYYDTLLIRKLTAITAIAGKSKKTKQFFFNALIFLKRNKKFAILVLLKILRILKIPLFLKKRYKSGMTYLVPVPLSYLKQWYLAMRLFRALAKIKRTTSFSKKLIGEFVSVYNDSLNVTEVQKTKHFLRGSAGKQMSKLTNLRPQKRKLRNVRFGYTNAFFLRTLKEKYNSLVDNRSYFHYRW